MSLQDISKEIVSKANLKIQELDSQTKAEMDNLEAEFESNFESYKSKVIAKSISEQNLLKNKLTSKYNKIAKEIELDAKSQIISQVKSETLDKINKFNRSEREDIYKKLIKLAKPLIDYDIVYTSKEDLSLVKTLVNDKIKVKSQDNLIGLVFEINSGLEKLDLNFKSLFEDIFINTESEVQQILFR